MNKLLKWPIVICLILLTACSSDDKPQDPDNGNDPDTENPDTENPESKIKTVLKASRISGPAPLAVQFSTLGTSHENNELDTFRELGYHFTFGDPASGVWKFSNKSKNSQIGGPIASHVFESSGVYLVKVRAQDSDGNFSDASIEISVTDPDNVYTAENTVIISKTSNVSGAPNGALELTNQSKWPQWESGKRYLLMSGQDFTSFGPINLKKVQDVQVGKNGTGSNPIVDEINIERGRPSTTNWASRVVVSDLNSKAINIPNTSEDIYIIRGTNTSFYVGNTIEHYVKSGSANESDSMRFPKNIFMYEATNTSPTTGFNSYVLSKGFSMMGTELANPSQHNIRPKYTVNTFIGHNYFYNAGPTHHNIKLHSDGVILNEDETLAKNGLEGASRWIVVANNTFGDGTVQKNPWSVTFDPQNSSSAEGVHDVIVENNIFKSDFLVETILGGRNLTERGNSSSGEYKTVTGQNVNSLPETWDGPYYLDAQLILPDAPN
ncbi:PKD domain-containing protein [Flavivirga eckloniae]|nr:PKD domain-containing protein [Flavivirga eckloniae]